MEMYAINKSNTARTVYSGITSPLVQIGTIYHNECFGVIESRIIQGSPGNYHEFIHFKSADGMKTGMITNGGGGEVTPFLNYSFGNVTGPDGNTYKSFKTRRALGRFDANGGYKGSVASGARILTNDTTPGESMPHCMRAMYYETGAGTGVFSPVSGTAGAYGFVDTGIAVGSDASKIGIYGNW